MQIRNPAVAGAFYPLGASELRAQIDKFISKVKGTEQKVIAAVAPHAGYDYCGRTAAAVYKSIAGGFDTAVILGPNHFGSGTGIATDSGLWRTPLGNAAIDEEFVTELQRNSMIVENGLAHRREHSIEVQLPWLQHRFKDFKFVPICINPTYFEIDSMRAVGNKIAETAKSLNRKILIVASSDFTHHGPSYGYAPFKGTMAQVLKKIKETDMEVAGYATRLMPERLLEVCADRRLTICGAGAIAAAIWAAQKLGAKEGKVVDYSTSFDVSRDTSTVVGYCGIVLY